MKERAPLPVSKTALGLAAGFAALAGVQLVRFGVWLVQWDLAPLEVTWYVGDAPVFGATVLVATLVGAAFAIRGVRGNVPTVSKLAAALWIVAWAALAATCALSSPPVMSCWR